MRFARFARLAVPALAAAAALAAPAPASAQLELGVGGGPSFPSQRLNDEADPGWHAQGSLWLGVPVLPVGLRGDVLWQTFPDDVNGDFRQLAGFASAVAELPSPVIRPYGLVGVGLVKHTGPGEDHPGHVHVDEDDTDVGFQVGAGVRLGLLGLNAFAEARWVDMGEDHAGVPLTVGIVF